MLLPDPTAWPIFVWLINTGARKNFIQLSTKIHALSSLISKKDLFVLVLPVFFNIKAKKLPVLYPIRLKQENDISYKNDQCLA